MFNEAYWINRHKQGYAKAAWRDKPSPFAQFAKKFVPEKSLILELGAGIGQDGLWFAREGFDVIQTELGETGLEVAREAAKAKNIKNIKIMKLDMTGSYPFSDNYFDVVYAHSCIQYFTKVETEKIFKEIYRVLKPKGILAVLVNSVNDLEYNQGPKIADNYFKIKGLRKRYFTENEIKDYINDSFKIIILDEKGESYKDQEVDNHGMIRLIARK
ncbi:MAG TPA: class I SAM-dependent methyltransferase [Patescibacteria group bacterium]|nr:class I SAM-dependent methyltransferase [Patescibacteria group bacterium]